jgi:hypothetical protein
MQTQLFRQGKDPDGPLSQHVPLTVPRYFHEEKMIEIEVGEGGFGVAKHCWNPLHRQTACGEASESAVVV